MVLVDGLSFGKAVLFAFAQSINSDESAFAQKARSSSSFLNSGIFFLLFIVKTEFPCKINIFLLCG